MPVYEYRCKTCGTIFEIFHKGREIADDISCTSCSSRSYTRLISVSGIVAGKSAAASCKSESCCGSEDCCGRECGFL